MTLDPMLAVWMIGAAVLSAIFGILLVATFSAPTTAVRTSVFADAGQTAAFVFDGEDLIDATPEGRSLLRHSPLRQGTAWSRLLAWLQPRIDGAAEALARLGGDGTVSLSGPAGARGCTLTAEARGGLMRVTIREGEGEGGDPGGDPAAMRAMRDELDLLRSCMARAPLPIWRETGTGDVVWSNAAYLDLAMAGLGSAEDLAWPLPRVFERQASVQGAPDQRQRVQRRGGGSAWFDLWSYPDATGRLGFAVPADSAVQAESALREFMQTLTKTFAHLPTGLAIFDQSRQLALFNPAMMDLTGLPPDMLSARPTLAAFFDALRDRAMLPEPKDYRSWRRMMTDLEQAASRGLYDETWTLPGGQTYRVTGRPHPNGALALMMEDISTEMSQTRRYRAELELGQAVVDAIDEAIAVFSAAGVLVMSNAAYARLWDHDPAATLDTESGIAAACAHWRRQCAPTTLWDRVEDFVAALEARDGWTDSAVLSDGRRLSCRFVRLQGGATLAGFRIGSAVAAVDPRPKVRKSA